MPFWVFFPQFFKANMAKHVYPSWVHFSFYFPLNLHIFPLKLGEKLVIKAHIA